QPNRIITIDASKPLEDVVGVALAHILALMEA
ncbi:dTMP kinase, partial [Streptococcus dysgalactiae]